MALNFAESLPGQLSLFDDPPTYRSGFRAGLEAAARSLDPKTRGESERPPTGQPFHKWYAARQVRRLIPNDEDGPVSGVFAVEAPATPSEPVEGDYTVQALSDRVAYLERELAGLETNYQESLRVALTEAADHITRRAADMMEEESQKLIVRPRSNEDMLDHLMVQVRGLALIFDEVG